MHALLIATGPALLASAAFLAVAFVVVLWPISLVLEDTSIVDFCWAPICAAVAWIAYAVSGHGMTIRAILVLAAVSLWGARLGFYIARRHRGVEDRRYADLRRRVREQGRSYALTSLVVVFLLQGAVTWIATLPLVAAVAGPGPAQPGALVWIGALLWLAGFAIEAIADAQMARFRAGRTDPDQVMDKGLWRYSRHPNYFGEVLVQWAFFLLACDGGPGAVATIVGPLLFTYLIVGPLGANLLERGLSNRKPAYVAYVRRTSSFVPWLPRR